MAPEDRHDRDAVLARVASARPRVSEADLSPAGDRAGAVLERVLASPRSDAPAERPRWSASASAPWRRLHRPAVGGLALAIAAVAVVRVFVDAGDSVRRSPASAPHRTGGGHLLPADDQIHIDSHATLPHRMLLVMDRTPLGRVIAQQYHQIQEDVNTGDAAPNRRAIQQLQFNEDACLHAAAVVSAVTARPGQRYLQYDWVRGARLQARSDAELIGALRAFVAGRVAAGRRAEDASGDDSDADDSFTSYAQNALAGQGAYPVPRQNGIEGPDGRPRHVRDPTP